MNRAGSGTWARRAAGGLLVLALVACSTIGATSIRKVTDDERKYDGKEVTIAGEVTGSLNLIVVKGYTVRDATGEMPVITRGDVPAKGAKVRVRGRVNQAFSFQDKSLVVLMEEPAK